MAFRQSGSPVLETPYLADSPLDPELYSGIKIRKLKFLFYKQLSQDLLMHIKLHKILEERKTCIEKRFFLLEKHFLTFSTFNKVAIIKFQVHT